VFHNRRFCTGIAFSTPRSIPTAGEILARALCSISQVKAACQPSGPKIKGDSHVLDLPSSGRVWRNFTQPIFGSRTQSLVDPLDFNHGPESGSCR